MKVLIIFNKLHHYRVPILNILSSKVDLTIGCENSEDLDLTKISFNVKKIVNKKIGPFSYFSLNDWKDFNRFDVIVGLFSIRNISTFITAFNPFRKYKFIYWGIGVPASYTTRYDESIISRYGMMFLSLFCDATIFYSSYPLKYYKKIRPLDSLFVADNTVDVPGVQCSIVDDRNSFLFIGSLYRQKGLEKLIENYHTAYAQIGGDFPSLNIVGGGELLQTLSELINKLDLEDRVILTGPIYDSEIIKDFFSKAILCVSPRQAGLSVLTSMAYSVPFVTTKRAFTGGEIFNIEDGKTGVLLDYEDEIVDVFLNSFNEKSKYLAMGRSSNDFYRSKRTANNMATKMHDAICYAHNKSK